MKKKCDDVKKKQNKTKLKRIYTYKETKIYNFTNMLSLVLSVHKYK